jgi:hypothetical protein
MIERYAVIAGRMRQELVDLERVVARSERAMAAVQRQTDEQDLYLDSAALNLHDFYAGLERIFSQIAATVDKSVPAGHDWHRELLRQMTVNLPQIRPQVLSVEAAKTMDEYLRFRHVVRNIYTFEFDARRVEHLVQSLRPCFEMVRGELLAFADFLEGLGRQA